MMGIAAVSIIWLSIRSFRKMVLAARCCRRQESFYATSATQKINLCVWLENEAAVKFYDKLGYAEEPVYYCGKG
jgi:ribosomal protein S18 acetylase RimI-like enzyme